MCFGGDNGQTAAAAAQQSALIEKQAQAHNDAVTQGKGAIDNAFSGFNDNYFKDYTKAYTGAYDPQVADQYNIARDKLTATLAGNGTLGGSVGNNSMAQLDKTRANEEATIGNQAVDATNSLKTTVGNAKTNLYNLNTTAADPSTMASQAQNTAGAIVAPQAYPTLGDVFGGVLAPVAAAAKTNQTSMNPFTGKNFFAPTSGNGSAIFG